jgi:NADH-quinone oxidoreductase subunit F
MKTWITSCFNRKQVPSESSAQPTLRFRGKAGMCLGIIAAVTAAAASIWLLSVYIHAARTIPVDKALVDSLKEKAKSDAEVQKILQPELDRQHEVVVKRRNAYSQGGLLLLFSTAVFLVWVKWFRSTPDAKIILAKQVSGGSKHTTGPIPLAPLEKADPAADVDLQPVLEILEKEGRGQDSIIPILQAIQAHYRYLPESALRRVCAETSITPAQIVGVATFYNQFRLKPVGKHIIRVCEGTACHVSGAVEVRNELRRCLGMDDGSDMDESGQFTIEHVACIGSCSLAPVITIDEKIYGRQSALYAGNTLQDFIAQSRTEKRNGKSRQSSQGMSHSAGPIDARQNNVEIRIGMGSCGIASGAQEVKTELDTAVASLGGGALIKSVGCSGLCHCEPLVEVIQNGQSALYGNVDASFASRVVRQHMKPRGVIRKLRHNLQDVRARLVEDNAWEPVTDREVDAVPYIGKQVRIVLENCGQIDPLSLEDYRKRRGMEALEKCITRLSPEEVIEAVRTSGLRGRGGAGFPTALKWEFTRRAPDSTKYVICNGDEGDPGAFMDRAVLEADPFRVIEGLVIAAYAIGSSEGFIYVRREYPIATHHMREAIRKAEEYGFLGNRILGTQFSFKLQVREGAGAFVCGEETALIASIEGKRGMPRPRPPYPAQSGLWGKPTLINNVETLACVPWIIRQGPGEFAALGTEKSKGTKVFSLVGKINRGGLIEVPMGITIREIVEDIGGGIRGGRQFKGILAGGPSGGCIPARLADTRIDYEELAATGSIMGSGGLVVLDDRDCAVEIARYFLNFTQNESCGKCTFCRIGTKRMLEILERICKGAGKETDLQELEELSGHVKRGSLCGLGQTAPNPVLTTLLYFRDEYEAHVREKRCPAGQCKVLIHYRVTEKCTGCTLCAQACPVQAIVSRPYERHEVIDDRCTRCGMCVTACLENAIVVA